jgi:hypothetical protein
MGLKLNLAEIILKTSARTAKKTQDFSITKINLLMLFKEVTAVHSESYESHLYKVQSHTVKADGI